MTMLITTKNTYPAYEQIPLMAVFDGREQHIEAAAETVLALGAQAIQFAGIERIPRYTPEQRENNAEHSFMLTLVATELAARYFPDYDCGLVAQFSAVHDLVELETGDVNTFSLDAAGLAAKAAAEHVALRQLIQVLPPHTASMLVRYERQVEPEARFVRLVDKLLPVVVDILGPGAQVMREDQGMETKEDSDSAESRLRQRFKNMFPEAELEFVHRVREALADQFSASLYDY